MFYFLMLFLLLYYVTHSHIVKLFVCVGGTLQKERGGGIEYYVIDIKYTY